MFTKVYIATFLFIIATFGASAQSEVGDFETPVDSMRYGSIHVTSNPDGATILLDGNPAGNTPALLSDLPVGNHTIDIWSEGSYKAKHIIKVLDSEVTDMNIVLSTTRNRDSSQQLYIQDSNLNNEKVKKPESFDQLPDFIVHPFGYNGVWDFKDVDKTVQSLKDYLRSRAYFCQIGSTFADFDFSWNRSQVIWPGQLRIWKLRMSLDRDILALTLLYDVSQYKSRYEPHPRQDIYEDMVSYLSDLNPAETLYSPYESWIYNVWEERVTLLCDYYGVTIFYSFD